MSYRNQLIKSIQTGTIDLNSVTSNTATITSVVTANSVIVFGGWTINASSLSPSLFARVELTNATTVTAYCKVGSAGVVYPVAYTVIEYFPGRLVSSQRGTITLNGVASNTATITAVTIGKAWVSILGFTYNSGGNNDVSYYPKVVLTNATTVTATTGVATPFDVVAGYQVVELR
jgi:hypothetical protein